MHSHTKRRKAVGSKSSPTTTKTARKAHTSQKKRSLKTTKVAVAPTTVAPVTSLAPTSTLIQFQNRSIAVQSEPQPQSQTLTPLLTTQASLTRPLTPSRKNLSHHDVFTTSKRGMASELKWKLESILPAPLLSLASALSISPSRLHSYGQTDKVRKKKSTGNENSGGSDNSNGSDDDDEDEKDKKKKSTKKSSSSESSKNSTETKTNTDSTGDENTGKDSSDAAKDGAKKTNKFKDLNTLSSIFNVTKEEIERLSAPSDEDHEKNKKQKKSSTDEDTKPKKKKSKKTSSNDEESDDESSDADKKSSSKKKKKETKTDGDDSEDKPDDEALNKLLKKGKKDKDEDGDDDDDEGPELSPRMKMALGVYRRFYQFALATVGAAALISTFKQSALLQAAQKGSYDEFRQYWLSGLLEKIRIYENNLVIADFATTLPETVPGPNGVDIPNPATIPPGFPTEYPFKVLDFSVFSRQLSADVAQFGIPDVNLVHSTSFGLESALEAMIWMTLFYMVSRKAVSNDLGWFNDKPASWTKGLGSAGMRGLTKPKAWKVVKNIPTRFTDVAGMDESKQEIVEFVDFLKNPDKYHQVGAKLPKGALLHGPPGTGKTLLAKAVAGEAGVPFIACSGSEFVQTYVGMGAKRVRDLFAQARKNAPCIIFIDEVDAIARKRDSAGNHDEKEATLNQLLVEMDGFAQNEKIIVLGATNRMDMLDKAFVRPGRIDRKILVDVPDRNGRKEVFKVHLQKVVHAFDPDELGAKLAALTPGLSGADISNICNEAAIYAARENKDTIELVDFEQAIDRVIAGLKKSQPPSKDGEAQRKIVAYHESGHAVAGWFLPHADPLLKVTITPRTNGALGFAQYMPKQSGIRQTEELYDRICVSLGGRVAEEIFFSKVSSGASDDLRKVTNMAHSMVVEWGMSPKLPNVVFPQSNSRSEITKPMSDRTSEIIDEEVNRIVAESYERTKKLLIEKKPQLEVLSETLLKEETINHDTIVRVLGPRPFQNDEYVEFMKQSKKQLTPQEKSLLGIKDEVPPPSSAASDSSEASAPPTPPTPTTTPTNSVTNPTEPTTEVAPAATSEVPATTPPESETPATSTTTSTTTETEATTSKPAENDHKQ